MAEPQPTETDLNPSKLGTKEYWDAAYTRETANFLSNPSDEGVIWFDESLAESRILSYLSSSDIPPTSSFLDIGTGNGHLLFELIESEDYDESTAMVGIDYSERSIELSRTIAKEREVEERVRFEIADVIKDELLEAEWVPKGDLECGFDVVLDKGTYDAISLSEETLDDGRRVYEDYPRKVAAVVKKGGLLVITSCNWTEEELEKKMLAEKSLKLHGRVKYPTFSFGGKTGQTICTVCFQKI
ncbi:S-adenosyl-L-methionine-dependent methyltransferase [Ascodesmis nigricans]|uniref:Protein-lysine N-methyltransferase EFM4 n=1 Tax=Ascodesmis nigricans TaxID=341454 RepID=A0A4S2N605_9PEZI|nr:S-adenosyl-L-methionine-dependent methyltransferase [Ascodesmis nigricans]